MDELTQIESRLSAALTCINNVEESATNNTGSSRIVISIIVAMIDATDAEVVEVKNQSDAHFYAFKWTSGGNLQGYYGVVISDYNGKLGITNVLSYTMTSFVEAHYATCDSPDATAIPVYNSSNVAYTTFKYTIGGVDYYYVLDEVQTDWADDLSSIGYSLTPLVKMAYLSTTHSDKYLNEYTEYMIVDETGNHIPYDSSKSYVLIGMYKVGGSAVTCNVSLVGGGDGYGNTILKLYNNSPRVEVGYVEYTVS